MTVCVYAHMPSVEVESSMNQYGEVERESKQEFKDKRVGEREGTNERMWESEGVLSMHTTVLEVHSLEKVLIGTRVWRTHTFYIWEALRSVHFCATALPLTFYTKLHHQHAGFSFMLDFPGSRLPSVTNVSYMSNICRSEHLILLNITFFVSKAIETDNPFMFSFI